MKVFALALFLLITGSAFAQNHMVQLSTNASGILSFSDSGPGKRYEYRSQYYVMNYARKVADRVQLGVEGTFSTSHSDNSKQENYGAAIGGIYNFSDDFTDAFYVSLYAGMSWSWYHFENSSSSNKSENQYGKVSIGKRIPLTFLKISNLVYSPEFTYTRNESPQYGTFSNGYVLKLIQFAVLF